ncbi:MAG: transglycosylase SLT domain-containing protein [Candidatus Margulisiibacteriota bacterium]|nr:transglycosylase SLT domain-containing protein [Candidatus Margulisiibacteriota bacterium]
MKKHSLLSILLFLLLATSALADGYSDFAAGQEHFKNKDYSSAIELFVASLSDPAFAGREQAMMAIAESHFEAGNPYLAAFYFSRILSEFPAGSFESSARERKGVCEALIKEKASSRKKLLGLQGYEKARKYASRGKYEQALVLLQRVVQKYPSSDLVPKALYYLGYYSELYGSPVAATRFYMRLFEEFPESYLVDNALYRAGRLQYNAGNKQDAERIFSQAYVAHNGDATPKCLFWWGKLLEEKNPADALKIYTFTAERYDHTYSGHKSREKLNQLGYDAEIVTYGMDRASLDSGVSKANKLHRQGKYNGAIKLVESKLTDAIYDGNVEDHPVLLWELSYPKGFWDHVKYYSNLHSIDPYLTLALIREESRFNPNARSRSWAKGLMQIIPSTGRILCKANKISYTSTKLYDAETNIRLGTYYLADLLSRFDGNVVFALAGYNGGPVRVSRWKKEFYNGDDDDFIIKIPIRETREYVQKVLGSYYEYKRLYGEPE